LLTFDRGSGTVGDAEGFVAQDDTNHQIVVAFRGADSTRNNAAGAYGLINVLIAPTAGYTCGTGCEVTPGFFQAYIEIRPAMLDAIRVQKLRNPTYTLVSTGHSFGGVLAHFAAVDLRRIYGKADLVNDP
jgi:predicted lipase